MAKRVPVEPEYFRIPEDPEEPPVLLASYSPAADKYFWPPRKRCPITFQPVEPRELSTEGELYSWTFVQMPWLGSQQRDSGGGFGAGQIDLPEGVRIQALLDGQQGDWEIGMPMRLTLRTLGEDDEGNEVCTIAFRVVEEGGAS